MSALSTIFSVTWARARLCWSFLLLIHLSRVTVYGTTSGSMPSSSHFSTTKDTNESLRASSLHTTNAFVKSLVVLLPRTIRILESNLQARHVLEQSIQLAAFQQFGNGKTGKIYNVSVSAVSSGVVQAVRLRSGSFRRYGIAINEFRIPRECNLQPIPERILIVYAHLTNTTLFQGSPEGYVLESPVLSLLAYDATNLNATTPMASLNVSTASSPINIQLANRSGLRCALFDGASTNVSYSDLVQGACQGTRFGAFALVGSANSKVAVSPRLPTSHSNAWKIILGSVVGGLALLFLLSLLAVGIASRRRKAKFARMEYHTDHGEALQTAIIGNSRVPAAGSTRTQSTIERDYSV